MKAEKVKKNLEKRKKLKEKKRLPLLGSLYQSEINSADPYEEQELFSLKEGGNFLNHLDNGEQDVGADEAESNNEDEWIERQKKRKMVTLSGDENEETLDDDLEELYRQYLMRKADRSKAGTKRRQQELETFRLQESGQLLTGKEYDGEQLDEDEDEDGDGDKFQKGSSAVGNSREERQWYSQNIFDILREDQEEKDEGEEYDGDLGQDSSELLPSKRKKTIAGSSSTPAGFEGGTTGQKDDDDFETVPKEMHDEETRTTTLALATKLLHKKERSEFIDNAFNRRAFNDDDLPTWFADDEAKHYQPNLPITKEDILKIKERFREVNERPLKKELEVRFRKMRKQKNKRKELSEKANHVAENPELSNQEKAKELQKIYKQSKNAGKVVRRRVYVKATGNVNVAKFRKDGSVVKLVDSRMKKDKRASDAASRKRKRK